jgi:hypothetical protein
MRIKLIYPKWRKLERQTQFHLPPHGPVVFAASLPSYADVEFIDENVDPLDLEDSPDIVALSVMLAAQVPRGFEIADHYRSRGIPVIAGGISIDIFRQEIILRP